MNNAHPILEIRALQCLDYCIQLDIVKTGMVIIDLDRYSAEFDNVQSRVL